MGSKGTVQLPQQQTQTNNVTPNPVALAAYSDLISRAQGVGSTPYQPYGGQLVQGFSPQQTQAFGEVGGLQGAAQPYIDRGAGLAMAGATAADPTHFGSNVGAYMSPYTDQVVNATMANINETNAQQQNNVVGNAIAKGAMGGDRVGVAQAELAREQNLSNNQTIAGLRNTGFQNATGELNVGAANQGQGAYSMGALGNEAQSTGLQGANALLQTGGLQQQLGQANLSTAYQQFLNQQAYPFQNLSWLSGLINGTGPNMGQSSTGMSQGYTSQLAPSPWNAILGAGVAGAGLFAPGRERGGRVGMANGGIPYADFAGGTGGVVGYVPPPPQIIGHGGLQLQKAPELLHPPGPQSASQGSSNFGSLSQAGRGLSTLYDRSGGLGGLFPDNHDYASDVAGGVAPLARGGGVRGYDDGGTVDYDPGILARNSQWSVPAGSSGYQTPLSADEQQQFNTWVKANNVPFQASPTADYDMPGYWKSLNAGDGHAASGLNANDGQMHFTDYFKTPYHKSFSAESKFATSGAPSWNAQDQLVAPNGSIVFDERAGRGLGGVVRRGYDDGGTVLDDTGGLGSLIEGRSVDDPYAERRYVQESGGRQFKDDGSPVISPKGAAGIAQVMPSTGPEAAGLAGLPWDENRFKNDETYNKALGDAYYAKQYADFGDHDKALAAYNAGPGRLRQALSSAAENGGDWKSYLPAETQNYVASITGSKDGGLGAISDATNSSGNGLGTVAEGRSADDGTAQSSDGLGGIMDRLRISPDTRTALIAAGLGMMASPSHWVGQAVGAGGLEGVKAYQTQQKTGIAQQTANQSGENIKSEIATRKGQLGISQQQIEQRAKELGIHLEQVRNQGRNIDSEVATRAAGLRETRFVPGVGWQLFDKANPDKGWQVISGPGNPASAPQSTSTGPATGTPAPATPSAPTISAAAAPPASPPAAEPPRGAAGMMNWKPTTAVPQGYVPQNHMAIYSNPEQVKHEGEMANKAIEQNRTDARNAMPVLYRLDEMDHAIDNLPKTGFLAQGTGANERAQIAKTGNTVAQFFHLPNIFDESKIASIENLNKDTFRLGAELSRQIGGREPGFIVQQAVQANPGVENTAAGYRRIVSGLREAARYQQDRNSFMDDYYGKFGHLNGAEDAFAKANSPQKYVDRAVLSTIDPRDAQVLQKHPDQAKAFDGLYGKGSAQLVLGQGAP